MKRFTRVAAVGAAALGLLAGATPAHAASAGAVAFVGNATLAPGLTYPTPGAAGSNGTWTLTSLVGAGLSAGSTTGGGTASLNASGALRAGAVQQLTLSVAPLAYLSSGGFCGLSGGSGGTGSVNISFVTGGGVTVAVSNVGWFQSAGSLIVFQGDTPAGENYLTGAVSALPNPTAGSCTNGTAVSFLVVGAALAVS